MGKYLQSKYKSREIWSGNISIQQSTFQSKECYKNKG